MSTTEQETKQAKGVCVEVSERGDWTTFHIDTGGQWPVKLSTKLPELVEQGRAAKDSEAVWTYKESQGGENPHKPGTYYTNRYMSKVEVGGTLEARADDAPTASGNASPAHPPLVAGDKDRAITRMACLKAACELYHGAGDNAGDSPLLVMKAAQRFETWVMRDIDETPF